MRLNHRSFVGSLILGVGAWLLRLIFRVLTRTYRVDIVEGREHLENLWSQPRPVIVSFWHNRVFLAGRFLFESLHHRGIALTLLASQSRDGELVTRVFRPWGIHTVRGSATRGGRQALRGVYRAIVSSGSSPVMIPDGPHGPIYQFKVGVAVLSQMAQAPILPLGFAAERFWRIKSWDRLIIPYPFTRVTVVIGEPQIVERGLTKEQLEETRAFLEERLDSLTLRAEAVAGAEDSARSPAQS